jgi:hypothetical protein
VCAYLILTFFFAFKTYANDLLIALALNTVGKFLVNKFELEGGFGMSLEGDCHELEVTLIL